ncbi:MAG: MFS transporter [Candidatus Caldarchaeum sp.]|nr:MFS transporter [Candidatus Caldarchaeum sp.]
MLTRDRLTILVGLISFTLLGWSVASISTSLPKIIKEFSIPYWVAGLLAGAMPIGGVMGFAAGMLSDRLGYSKTAALALFVFMLGLLTSPIPVNMAVVFTGFVVIGVGSVLLVSSASPLVASAFPRRSGTMLNYMYAGWGFGIGVGSVATAFLAELNWRMSFLAPVPLVLTLFLTALKKLKDYGASKATEGSELSVFVKNLPVVVPSLFIVGVELGFATWLPSLLSIKYSGLWVGLSVTIFSVFMGLGRTFLGRIADFLGPVRSITYLGACAALFFLLFSIVDDLPTKLMMLPVIGLAVGPLLPTFTAWVIAINPAHGGSVAGMVISFGRVGTFFVNWMVGLVLGLFGELSAVMVFLLSCLMMIVYLNLLVRLMGLGVGHRRA